MLVDPGFGGGIRSVKNMLENYLISENKNLERLIEYGEQLGNGAVFKRLGFLLEKKAPDEAKTIEKCYERLTAGNTMLDTLGFEEFLENLDLLNPAVELIVIDEIGKMELFSSYFRNLVRHALNADKQVLATISLKGNDFIWEIKQRLDIHLLEVTHANRYRLPEAILEGLQNSQH